MTFRVLRSTGQLFCRLALIWDLPDVSLMIRWIIRFWEEDHKGQVPSPHSYRGYILSIRLIIKDVNLGHLAELSFVRILHCKVTFLLPILYSL